jgi:hypothetical protein
MMRQPITTCCSCAPDVIDAIRRGLIGKIAVSYLEWAGATMACR